MQTEDLLEVLLVDDELSTRELLEQFCRSRQLTVTTAHDGRAAITAIERAPSRFSIVLTDVHMPGADGFEVLKAAKKVNRGCYVVMITGYASLDSALRAVREGAYDYLAKPFSLGQLDVMLARIRDRMALERENRDLRRRLHGTRGIAPVAGAAAAAPLTSPLAAAAPPPPPAAPVTMPTIPRPTYAAPAPAMTQAPPPQAPASPDRLVTIEERMARLEELLLAASVVNR
jgi:DNA-binding NtrC family response regulator